MSRTEMSFRYKDTDRFKFKKWKEIYHENSKHMKTGITALISDQNRLQDKECCQRQ